MRKRWENLEERDRRWLQGADTPTLCHTPCQILQTQVQITQALPLGEMQFTARIFQAQATLLWRWRLPNSQGGLEENSWFPIKGKLESAEQRRCIQVSGNSTSEGKREWGGFQSLRTTVCLNHMSGRGRRSCGNQRPDDKGSCLMFCGSSRT